MCTISSAASVEELEKELSRKSSFKEISAPADDSIDGFWICFGDGLVYTPYLKSSDGNIGYGEIFDYEQELEPSKDFAHLIRDIIEDET